MHPAKETAKAHDLPSLTGLRFIAAFAVFTLHVGLFHRFTRQGVTGVSFFFILSGFVLAWSGRPDDTARAFWRRRAARILPAYWIAWTLGLLLVLIQTHFTAGWKSDLPSLSLLQSWFTQGGVNFAGNGVGWSLSCEAFFYACFPLLIVVARRLSPRTQASALVALLAAAISWSLVLHPETTAGIRFWAVYICPVSRALEFSVGILLALRVRAGARPPVGLRTAAILTIAAYAAAGFVPVYAMLLAVTVIPFSLLIAAAAVADLEGRPSWARAPRLVLLGQWSYAFYLLHQLVLRYLELPFRSLTTVEQLGVGLVALVASVALAGLLYTVVERPLERRLRGGRARQTREPIPHKLERVKVGISLRG